MRCLLKRGNIPKHRQDGASPLISVLCGRDASSKADMISAAPARLGVTIARGR